MVPDESRRDRRNGRPRSRSGRVAVEGLETRQLLAYSSLGFSLPSLAVTGYAPTEAAYGQSITVDVTVENRGASSIIEPLDLAPGSSSTADSPATTVQVFAAAKPNATRNVVLVDTVDIPAVRQNSDFNTISTFNLPARPAGFPGLGGKVYLTFVVDNNVQVQQVSRSTNIYHDNTPITIVNPLPDLQVAGLDVPGTLQPGDVISPTIRIVNLGAANPNAQGPVTVELIASTDTTYGPGDAVVGSFTITSLPGVSGVPTQGSATYQDNVILPPNEIEVTLPPLQLPTSPSFYYLGVKIDPNHNINQTYAPNASLGDLVTVGPPNAFLPAATEIATTSGLPVFPEKPSTFLTPITTTTPTTPTTTTGTTTLFPVASFPGSGNNGGLGPIFKAASTAKAKHVAAAKPASSHAKKR